MTPYNPPQPTHPIRVDQETLSKLDMLDYRLLSYLDFLSSCQAKKSPTGARYCNPGEKHLAEKLGVTRETISHHITKLTKLGVLSTTHRRKLRGVWQTNLYYVRRMASWAAGKLLAFLREAGNHVKRPAHLVNPMREISVPEGSEGAASPVKGLLTGLLARVLAGEALPET